MNDIYHNIFNNNYIKGEIKIEEEDINKEIQIINSDNSNEKEIKEGCIIEINDLNLSNFNTENVTHMSYMFYGASSLSNLNLSNFNTQNVIGMDCMLWMFIIK